VRLGVAVGNRTRDLLHCSEHSMQRAIRTALLTAIRNLYLYYYTYTIILFTRNKNWYNPSSHGLIPRLFISLWAIHVGGPIYINTCMYVLCAVCSLQYTIIMSIGSEPIFYGHSNLNFQTSIPIRLYTITGSYNISKRSYILGMYNLVHACP
jgi:hypothetical protein